MLDAQTLAKGSPQTEQERREAERAGWLERAEENLRAAQIVAEGTSVSNPAALAAQLKSMVDKAGTTQCLTGDDRKMLAERSKALSFTAYERALEQLMGQGREAIRGNDQDAMAPLLKGIADHMGELRKLGLSAEDAESLKQKIEILRQTSHAGDSEKAKKAEKDTGPRPYLNDRRMFVRYTDPTLIVVIGGRRYLTVDWSLGGARVGGVERCPGAIGALVSVRIKVEGGPLHEEKVTIVRYDENSKELALQFRRFGSSLVAIKRECAAIGLDPC
jgi:hypothetical protein